DHIWRPLGMQRTTITLTPEQREHLAVGYEIRNGVATAQSYEWFHTTPASSINATAADMARFMLAHLNGGRLGDTRILEAATVRTMQAPHGRGHPDVPGVAYGFFESEHAGERILEHGGVMAGTSSSMVLLPDRRAGFFVANHVEQSGLRDAIRNAILDRFYSRRQDPPVVSKSEDFGPLARFAGRYRWNVYCHSCGTAPPTQGPTVEARADGTIDFAGQRWVQIAPLVFRRDDGKRVLAFRADSDGAISHLFIEGPLTFERIR
ncbi:MAG TPA: serine hydrolase domain-containing protein, partial [Vicinamibacterales bacterium]|nr:serine hydrolase domain-containing protein [Vicinamibacterales bacterium]